MNDDTSDRVRTDRLMNVWARVIKTSRNLLERVERKLKNEGFPPLSWYDVLLELRREDSKALRPVDIERRTLLAQYNVSRLLDRITKAGYAEKARSEDDGRGMVVKLTASGEQLLDAMWPVYRSAVENELGQHLTEEEMKLILEALKKIPE